MNSVEVKGMTCNHCRKSVQEAVSKVAGVKSVEVDLEKGLATWTDKDPAAPASLQDIKDAINGIGFEA